VAVIGCSTVTDRLPDAESIVRAIAEHRPVQSIAEPGLLDGGDVVRIGRTLYVAESHRTNADGISQLREITLPFGYDVRTVEIRECPHLKTGCSFIPPHFVLLNPRWVSPDAFGDLVVIPVDEKEPFAANTLTIGKTTLVSASHPKTEKRLKEAGITTRKLNISEIEKAQAGLSCISLLLEPRPAVQAPGEAAPKPVHAGGAPSPNGHASQAVVQNGTVYVSAQTAFEQGTKPKRMPVEEQTEQAIRHLSLVLTAAGSSLARVVRTTVHVANPKDMERIDAVYARLFGPHRPARTIVANGALGAGVAVAIEAIAATGNEAAP
jgi:dimethylargininase